MHVWWWFLRLFVISIHSTCQWSSFRWCLQRIADFLERDWEYGFERFMGSPFFSCADISFCSLQNRTCALNNWRFSSSFPVFSVLGYVPCVIFFQFSHIIRVAFLRLVRWTKALMMLRFSWLFRRACITCRAIAVFLLLTILEGDVYGFLHPISIWFAYLVESYLHSPIASSAGSECVNYTWRTGRESDSSHLCCVLFMSQLSQRNARSISQARTKSTHMILTLVCEQSHLWTCHRWVSLHSLHCSPSK